MSLFWYLLAGAIAGWLAGIFMKGNGLGLMGDVIVGVIGAFGGAFLFHMSGLKLGTGLADAVLVAFVGAVALLFVVRLFANRGSRNRMWS